MLPSPTAAAARLPGPDRTAPEAKMPGPIGSRSGGAGSARVVGEGHGRLPGRVSGTDDVDVEAVRVRCLATCRAVGDALAAEPVEAVDRQLPPRDAAGEDDRPRPQHVAAVEVDLTGRGVD